VRDLEDQFAVGPSTELEQRIVATSLRFGVLCRFTAFVAVDRSEKVNEKGEARQIVQPVDLPEGWAENAALCGVAGVPMLAAPATDKRLNSLFGAVGLAGPASYAAPKDASRMSGGDGLQRRKRAMSPPPAAAPSPPAEAASLRAECLSLSDCDRDERESLFDLSAYRARAAVWLGEFQRLPDDAAARGEFLRELARKVADLVADLSSIGASPSDVDPLGALATALSQLGPAADAAEVDALLARTVQVLSAFAQVRPPFWKQSPQMTV
jgi:Ca-activated chloride channel family protein